MKTSYRKLITVVFVVVLLVGLGIWTYWRPNGSVIQSPSLTKVALATATLEPYTFYIETIGVIESHRQVLIAPEVEGAITGISFESGAKVVERQILVQLNDAPEQGDLTRLQGQLATARIRMQRLQILVRADATSRQSLDDARAEYDAARGELARVQARIIQKTIRAPFDGDLGIRRIHLGQYLQAGTPIVTLSDLNQLQVNFSVAERDTATLDIGQKVQLQVDALPDQWFDGVLNAIDPQIGNSHTLFVQAQVTDPTNSLRPGMYARVKVEQRTEPTLLIPETAITYTAYGETVFVVEQTPDQSLSVKRINVRTGERRDSYITVESGITANQQVVVSGQLKLYDGMLIEPVADSLRNTLLLEEQ